MTDTKKLTFKRIPDGSEYRVEYRGRAYIIPDKYFLTIHRIAQQVKGVAIEERT